MKNTFITPHENISYQPIKISVIEETHNARFIGDFCIKTNNGDWSYSPAAIFYQPNPDTSKGHTHYFGIFVENSKIYITDGSSAFDEPIVGIVADNGEVIFSRYRHDYVASQDKSVWIDGGRDYYRCNNPKRLVHITIDQDKLIVNDIPNSNS